MGDDTHTIMISLPGPFFGGLNLHGLNIFEPVVFDAFHRLMSAVSLKLSMCAYIYISYIIYHISHIHTYIYMTISLTRGFQNSISSNSHRAIAPCYTSGFTATVSWLTELKWLRALAGLNYPKGWES